MARLLARTGLVEGTTVAVNQGGTGQSSYAQGDILYASASNVISKLAKGTDNYILAMNGNVPNWEAASAGGLYASIAIICDSKAGTSNGGGLTLGAWRTRDLQTEIADADGIVSISANQFTLAAATYTIEWSCNSYNVGHHGTRLASISGGTSTLVGAGINMYTVSTSLSQWLGGCTSFTISGTTNFEIQHKVATTNSTDGGGRAFNAGHNSIFVFVKILKHA